MIFSRKKYNSQKITVPDKKISVSDSQPAFCNLPLALYENEISSFLDITSQTDLTFTCKNSRAFFRKSLEKAQLKQLLQYVIYGNEDQVKKIIAMKPHLLLLSETVTAYSGHTIKGSALQIAWGAEDEILCKIIIDALKKLPDGQVVIIDQYQKQFPDDENTENEALDLQALDKITQLIAESKKDEECASGLNEFRMHFTPTPDNVITTGKHFNIKILITALRIYIQKTNYHDPGHWDERKDRLFWCKVIGYLQRLISASYAQAFCQGFEYLFMQKKTFSRSLKLCSEDAYFFPLDLNNEVGLGFDYAVGSLGSRCISTHNSDIAISLDSLYKRKTAALQKLILTVPSNTCCLIL